MAEAILNSLRKDKYEASSAGVSPTKVNPHVVKVMAEIGIDISKNRSKSIEEFRQKRFNYVVTVCDSAKETCPFFPGEKIIHKAFQDPNALRGSEEEILKGTRQVRNEIAEWIKNTFN
jgi:arsenate reductase